MGLRTRIKERLSGILGSPAPTPARPAPAPPRPAAAAPAAPAAPTAPAARPAPPPPKPLSPEEQAKQEKIAAHFEKARRGVLQQLADKGGRSEMADMHDYSERRYFIAHQAFSRMMEGFVAEGLIDYEPRTGQATLTEKGRGWLESGASAGGAA